MPAGPEPIRFNFIVERAWYDKEKDAWTLTIEVPTANGPQVAALSAHAASASFAASVVPMAQDSSKKL